MLAGFMYGPIPAIIIIVIKEALHIPIGGTGGVGELANLIITISYAIVPSIVYCYKKGIKTVVITLFAACIIQVGVSILINKYVNFPFFTGSAPFVPTEVSNTMFDSLWIYILIFNAIKSVAISLLTIVLYKKVSYLFKKIKLQNSAKDV